MAETVEDTFCHGIAFIGTESSGKSTLVGEIIRTVSKISEREFKKLTHAAQILKWKPEEAITLVPVRNYYSRLSDPNNQKEWPSELLTPETKNCSFDHLFFEDAPTESICVIDTPGNHKFAKNLYRGLYMAQNVILVLDVNQVLQADKEEKSELGNAKLSLGDRLVNLAMVCKDYGIVGGVVIALNKMDLIPKDQQQTSFDNAKQIVRNLVASFNIASAIVPVSSREPTQGIFDTSSFPWFNEGCLLDTMRKMKYKRDSEIRVPHPSLTQGNQIAFVVGVTYGSFQGKQILMGRVEAGTIKEGMELTVASSKPQNQNIKIVGKVTSMRVGSRPVRAAQCGSMVGIALSTSRTQRIRHGEVLVPTGSPSATVHPTEIYAFVRVFSEITANHCPLLECHSGRVVCKIAEILCKQNRDSAKKQYVPVLSSTAAELKKGDAVLLKLTPWKTEFFGIAPAPSGKLILRDNGYIVCSGNIEHVTYRDSMEKESPLKHLYRKLNPRDLTPLQLCITAMLNFRIVATQIRGNQVEIKLKDDDGTDYTIDADEPFRANIVDKTGTSPLIHAIRESGLADVEAILNCGADMNLALKAGGPLHVAMTGTNPQVEVIDYFLKKGITVNSLDENHNTPLHILTTNPKIPNAIKLVEALADRGADFKLKNKAEKIPLQCAWENENCDFRVLEALVIFGGNFAGILPELKPSEKSIRKMIVMMIHRQSIPTVPNYLQDLEPPVQSKEEPIFDWIPKDDPTMGPRVIFNLKDYQLSAHAVILWTRGFNFDLVLVKPDENFLVKEVNDLQVESLVLEHLLSYIYTDDIKRTRDLLKDEKPEHRIKFLKELTDACRTYFPPQRAWLKQLLNRLEVIKVEKEARLNTQVSELRVAFDSPRFSDVKLVCEDKTFHAHKAILMSRSPFFKSMFTSGMAEASQEQVVLKSIAPNVLKNTLEFIYGGDTSVNADNALPLLNASNEYQLPALTALVELTIAKNVDRDNVVDLLQYAEANQAKFLEKVCEWYCALVFSDLKEDKKKEVSDKLEKINLKKSIINKGLF
eukprot:TRINITY_DN1170_c4_g1_i1.p1 TRINITY_DN1170_c4_g1~~TRINITY_DN1170_c4_g1_i1.p1  ORF type:complete len:1064 (+),score=350.86 TRINITY_DN1170_c4_g1_i1:69-3194(+)